MFRALDKLEASEYFTPKPDDYFQGKTRLPPLFMCSCLMKSKSC